MAFPEMKVYCPPQPARPINNGTFTKNPELTTPTYHYQYRCTPEPLPKYIENNPPFSSLKLSNCLLTVFTPPAPRKRSKRWWEPRVLH